MMMDGLGYGQPAVDTGAVEQMLADAYACFGRQKPAPAVVSAVAQALADLEAPEEFLPACRDALADLADLPRNLVRHIRRVIWPEWLAGRCTGAVGGRIAYGRPDCEDGCGGTGWHRLWRAGAPAGSAPVNIPCRCNARLAVEADGRPVRTWTRAELLATGEWRETDPADDIPVDDDGWSREAVQASLAGAGKPGVRPEGEADIPF